MTLNIEGMSVYNSNNVFDGIFILPSVRKKTIYILRRYLTLTVAFVESNCFLINQHLHLTGRRFITYTLI